MNSEIDHELPSQPKETEKNATDLHIFYCEKLQNVRPHVS